MILISKKFDKEYNNRIPNSSKMKSTKIVLIALVAIVVSSQGYGFQNFGVDQDLVRATDSSMSNLQGLLTVFSCQGNTYFLPYLASSIAMEEDSIPVVMPS